MCPFRSEKTQNKTTAKDAVIKPAKLSRGRAPKPLVPLGRKWGKKTAPATKAKDADNEDKSVGDGASNEQVIARFRLDCQILCHIVFCITENDAALLGK